MFGKTEEKTVQPVKTKKTLSRADKKQIQAALARANRTDKKGISAQDSIPYELSLIHIFFETGRVLDGIFGFFHLFRSANNSSRSL